MPPNRLLRLRKMLIYVARPVLTWSLMLVLGSMTPVEAQSTTLTLATLQGIPTNFEAQIEDFRDEHQDIDVIIINMELFENNEPLTFEEFRDQLLQQAPDVVLLTYNLLAILHQQSDLQALDDFINFNLEDYSQDALDSNRFDGNLFGLPVFQYGCYPAYYDLALLAGSENPEVAFELMAFLIGPDQQRENFETVGWYPTHLQVYEEVAFDCPQINPLPRPSAEEVNAGEAIVQALSDGLASILEGKVLNPFTTAIIVVETNGQTTLQRVATPVTDINTAGFDAGEIVGAMHVDDDPFLPAGDYVVKCRGIEETDEVSCTLVDNQEQETEVDTEWVYTGVLPGLPVAVAATETIYFLWFCIK